ncbi:MAG: 4-(cytidine 5'-diphospho)-2-C-methyl-D-erythritol kinase [Acetobacterales bacterium]
MTGKTADPVSALIFEVSSKVETARAKINLALHITGRRVDGYHLLDSLVVFAEVADTIRAAPLEEGFVDLVVDGQFGGDLEHGTPTDRNLAYLAADALIHASPGRRMNGVRLLLTKRLPIASGLGGGSADAAATLRLLNRFWGLGLPAAQLAELGVGLGADVPCCLVSRPLRAEGIGERITPLPGIPSLPIVILNPGVALETRSVFRRLPDAERKPMGAIPKGFKSIMEFVLWLRRTRNDLYEPANALEPAVGKAVRALAADPECLFARMSGSGATVFGIFLSAEAADRAATRIHASRPDWWLAVTRTAGS